MESSGGHALDSKQIHEQLHDDSDFFTEFIHDSDIDIFHRIVTCLGGTRDENDGF
jgi:hypothetical protein